MSTLSLKHFSESVIVQIKSRKMREWVEAFVFENLQSSDQKISRWEVLKNKWYRSLIETKPFQDQNIYHSPNSLT